MTTKVVLPREGAVACMADVGLGPVGVMGCHVGLEIEGPSKGYGE